MKHELKSEKCTCSRSTSNGNKPHHTAVNNNKNLYNIYLYIFVTIMTGLHLLCMLPDPK